MRILLPLLIVVVYGGDQFGGFYDCNKPANARFNLNIIDFQKGEVNLENVTHEEAVATLKTTQDRVVLVVAKPESAFTAPASETSYSPQLCEYFILNQ